jgi:MFS transporter, MHS family, proline/betaine transporter
MNKEKEVWIGWLSSLSGSYNIAVYGFVAPFLAPLLFQKMSEAHSILFSYVLIFIGCCLLYPIGAFYYSSSTKKVLDSTLGLALTTGLMGIFPRFLLEGGWLYFLILVSIQHFFWGGDYYGSIVFSLRHSQEKKKGLMSSLSGVFTVLGLALANGLATVSLLTQNDQWMRSCFFVGAVCGLTSYFLKRACHKDSVPLAPVSESTTSLLKEEKWKLITASLVLGLFLVIYAFIFLFLPLVCTQTSQDFATFKAFLVYGICLVLGGWIADKWDIRKTLWLGICLFSLLLIPVCYLFQNLFLMQTLLIPFACLAIGPVHSWVLYHFSALHRFRGVFISSAIATSIFAASTVPICLFVFEKTQSLVACCFYPLFIALITFGFLVRAQQVELKTVKD